MSNTRANVLGLLLTSVSVVSAVAWAATRDVPKAGVDRAGPQQTAMSAAAAGDDTSTVPSTPGASADPQGTPPVPLLWKVSDANNSLYLLGSLHLLKPADYPLSADVDQAFATAERVVFEVSMAELREPATAQKFATAATFADERRLSTVLPPLLREKLDRLLARQGGASVAMLDALEPWYVNLSLTLGMAQREGFVADIGLDQHLAQRAADAGKPTGALETIDFQLDALDGAPLNEQVDGLVEFVDRFDEMPGVLGELHAAWREGDVVRLERLTREEMQSKAPESYRIMNVARNDAWVPKLQAMLDGKRDDVLVVVGALHLLGQDGVVEKLRAKGYEVTRVCTACDAVAGPGRPATDRPRD